MADGASNLLVHLVFVLLLLLPLQAVKAMAQLDRLVRMKPSVRVGFYRSAVISQWLIVLLIAVAVSGSGTVVSALGLVWPEWTAETFAVSVIVTIITLAQSPIVPSVRERLAGSGAMRRALYPLRNLIPRTKVEKKQWVYVAITAGICEELIFRGFLFFYFTEIQGTSLYTAVVLSTAIFGASHYYQGLANVVRTGLIGLLLGIAYAATGSLLVPILLHTALDLGALYMDRLIDADGPLAPGE